MRAMKVIALAAVVWMGVQGSAMALDPLVKPDAIPGSFSANVALTSEYVFRGISQTDGRPAIQGGFDYELPFNKDKSLGLYLGTWGSNVDFTDATLELDVYGGLQGTVGPLGWKLGLIRYIYPGAASDLNYDFTEIAGALSYDAGFLSLNAGLNYSPEYFGKSGNAYYYALGVEVPIVNKVALTGHVGYQTIKDNAAWGTDDYMDYSIGASINLLGFDISAAWTDTDLSKNQCDELCGIFTVTASRSF